MKAPRFLLGLGLLGLATLTVGKPIVRAGAAGVRDSPATPQAEPPGRPTQIPGNVLAPTAVAIVRFSDVAAQDDARRRTLEQLRTRQLGQRMPPEGEHDEPTAPGLQSLTIGARDSIPAAGVPSPAPTLSYEGLDDISDGSFFYIPPDTTGAVGPTHVFNTLNNNYRILTKSTGATVSTVSQNSFWRPVNPADGVFDPQALYDPYQNRFIVAAVASAQSTSSSLLVGVSNSSDPGGTWTLARYPMGSINCTGSVNCWADYPTLGFNQTWMAVGVNMFTVSNNAFVESRVTAFDYSIFLSGTAPALDYFVTSDFTVHPVVTYSNTQTTLYLPTHYSSNSAAYRLNTITGTASTPVYTQGALKAHSLLSGWASPGGDILPQASEPGTGLLQDIDAGDARIINAVFRNNAIWYTQTIALPAHGPISRTAAQWVKLDVLGNDVDAGRVQDATATPTNGGKWYAFPSIAVNANNDVLLGYSQFSSAQFASAGYSFRFSGDAAGTMRDPTISKNGIGFYYKTFSGDANRWGDFSQTTVDPSDDISLWTVQEFSNAQNGTGNGSGKWSTWWTQITPASTYSLTINKIGSGSGAVTSSPAGIDCGATCSASFSSGQVVTLTATPAAGSLFGGWTGDADCSDGSVTMTAARNCTATFTQSYSLTINKTGSGSGTVTSNPAGISCGATCSTSFASGQVVALTATPAAGSIFDGWSGDVDCSDGSVTMSSGRTCTATFTQTYTLSISKAGSGTGTVTSSPAGINCGAACNASFSSGQVVALTATPAAGSIFDGWSGDADCTDGSVTMSAARSCTATFTQTYTLTINKTGSGTGTVTSSPAGINCGATCGASFVSGQVVALTPTPASGSLFGGWSGDADCSDGSVTMSAAQSCTAMFTQTYALAITKAGNGSGTVTSNPVGINCGATCGGSFSSGQVVALTATPAAGSIFDGWSGDADCTDASVTMSAARNCIATFSLIAPGTFGKTSPVNDVVGQPTNLNLSWQSANAAISYQYCYDTTNNGTCDTAWTGVGAATNAAIIGLATNRVYYWQARAVNNAATTEANGGMWWAFTTDAGGPRVANDFNGDGHADLVWRNYATGTNIVWQMNDTQILGAAAQLPDVSDPNWKLLVVADLDGDKRTDLLWRHVVTGDNLVWRMSGTSVTGGASLTTVSDPNWTIFGAADADGNGQVDLFWRNTLTGDQAIWYLVNGAVASTGGLPAISDRNWQPAAAIDMDGDGIVDIVQRNDATGENRITTLQGAVKASIPPVSDVNWVIAAVIDLDGDQRPDLVWRNTATGQDVVWHMNGGAIKNSASLTSVTDMNWRMPGQLRRREPTDFNSDGAPDFVWRHAVTGDNVLWHMDGTSVLNVMSMPGVYDTNWKIAAIADFNHDRNPDLVWRNTVTGDDVLWLMRDATVLQTMPLTSVANLSWDLVGAGDLNHDGNPDLLWRNTTTGENVVWFMNGPVIQQTAPLTTVADTNWKLVATADLNRDQYADLIWRNSATGANLVWYMNGNSLVASAPLPTVADTTWTLAIATDVNGDGAPDLVWRNTTSGLNVVWYMNGTTVLLTVSLSEVTDTQWKLVK